MQRALGAVIRFLLASYQKKVKSVIVRYLLPSSAFFFEFCKMMLQRGSTSLWRDSSFSYV